LFAVPREPTLRCLVEETAITIFLTQGAGRADTFTLTCSDCPDTKTHENVTSHRFTGLVPYTTYTFSATAVAGRQTAGDKESEVAQIRCNASVGRMLLLICVTINIA